MTPPAMTMTQKILAAHAGLDYVEAGTYIEASLDLVLGNDITAPVAIEAFKKCNATKVFNTHAIALVPDHFAPNKDLASAEQTKILRDFAKAQNIEHYFEVGKMGIEHVLIPEQGLALPGEVIIGADSHTCTYGALGAFSTGVGSTDMGAAMASGKAWFKVPEAIRVVLTGSLPSYVSGKDVILSLIGQIGVEGANYKSLEFTGPGVAALSMDDRFTIANMAIEAGAKNGIFPVDELTLDYLKNRTDRPFKVYHPDQEASYLYTYTIDLSELRPVVALPHLPENVKDVDSLEPTYIDQVVIGSCTNGRIEDIKKAAQILMGRRVAKNLRVIVIPGSQQVMKEAMAAGYIEAFIDAGCAVSTPTCGPCLGGHMGILAKGERCLSTTNRNFVGRMGHVESEVYLCSPEVAAASAITGFICSPTALSFPSKVGDFYES